MAAQQKVWCKTEAVHDGRAFPRSKYECPRPNPVCKRVNETTQICKMHGTELQVALPDEDKHISAVIRGGNPWEDFMDPIFNKASQISNKDALVMDVGAHVGYHTLKTSHLGHPVLAFEPQTRLSDLLNTSVKENGLNNVTVYPYAVSSHEENLTLFEDKIHSNMGNAKYKRARPKEGQEVTKTVTLDNVWKDKGKPDVAFVKMDVEGFEKNAIIGAKEMITQTNPVIVFEDHSDSKITGLLEQEFNMCVKAIEGGHHDYVASSCDKIHMF